MTLLEIVKLRLGYLKSDEKMDEMLQGLIEEGQSFLSSFCIDLNFESSTRERSLLIEWIRYALSNALDDFRKNYRDELLALSNRGKVMRYASSQESGRIIPTE
ncbi:MAG: hypothetical protein HDR44_02335 [Allobaculum sp.]|nr:hypothetical protein [Allobaculum sp.]